MVDGIELVDKEVDRSILKVPFHERINVTKSEKEHLLKDYTLFVMNTIATNFPEAFPDLKPVEIIHQYSDEFSREVKIYTGPLIFETESTLSGISEVITKLIDVVCPVLTDSSGKQSPAFPTTFSGDNKTEKSSRSAQLALCDNGSMRDRLQFIEGRHELLHFLFMLSDVVIDCFGDADNMEEAVSLSRLISMLNPKLLTRKGKDDYYQFRDLFHDIFVALLSQFVCNYLDCDNLKQNVTPTNIQEMNSPEKKQSMLQDLFRNIIRNSHVDYEDCLNKTMDSEPLPKFYPHQNYVRSKYKNQPALVKTKYSKSVAVQIKFVPDQEVDMMTNLSKPSKPDAKNDYMCSLLSFIGQLLFLVDCQKNGNALNTFLIQKKLTKIVFSTGHKNYSSTLINFKRIVLGHWSPQFSHRYMWNISAGRAGKGEKMARDQREEHLNRYLKDSFKSVGVNLDEKNATRINNSCDLSMKIERNIVSFHKLDLSGIGHTDRDRSKQIEALADLFKREKVAHNIPGRSFKGPIVSKNLDEQFDEANYRVWHYRREKEMHKFSEFCRTHK